MSRTSRAYVASIATVVSTWLDGAVVAEALVDATVRALMALARAKAAGTDADLLADLADWFGSQPAIAATELPDDLIAKLVARGYTRKAVMEAGRLASSPSMSGRSRYGSPAPKDDMTAARRVAVDEPRLRAQFVIASSHRLTEAEAEDRLSAQLADEQRYRDMHVAMGRKRRQAARQVDDAAKRSRDGWLVWRCAAKPEAVCAALDGRLFKPDNPPGAYPGAVHPSCRCHAEPWMGVSPG